MRSKKQLREEYLKIRRGLNRDYIHTASDLIMTRVLQLQNVVDADSIFIYLDFDNEVKTETIRESLSAKGKILFYPRIEAGIMHAVSKECELERHPYGFIQPKDAQKSVDPDAIDIIIAPGVAFDINKNRIGYGKGYYDRFFKKTRAFKIGLAFNCQISQSPLPTEPFDATLDMVITDSGIIY